MTDQIFWEQIEIGSEIPTLEKHPTNRQLVQWAGASGDFYEIHYDREYAQKNNLPGQIVHGALKGAWMGQLLTQFAGEKGRVIKFAVSYRGMDVPGDTITGKGKVTKKYTEGNDHRADVEIWLENGKGEKTTMGTGVVALPVKG